MQPAFSAIVCCHNSAKRLKETLGHLAAQQVPASLGWEVVLVDNGSTDDTVAMALALWPRGNSAPLRVVAEPRLGLSFARKRGFAEAHGEIVCFVDDDNWVAADWASVAVDVMRRIPTAGACGGQSQAACEVPPPAWFDSHKAWFAVGEQGEQAGDVTDSRGHFWGAGLVIRRSAMARLQNRGFTAQLIGRQGGALSSGEDSELCFALRLAGWRLYYEPRLRFQHFLPSARLNWAYLRRSHRGFGRGKPVLALYQKALQAPEIADAPSEHWARHAAWVLRAVLAEDRRILWRFRSPLEANPQVLAAERRLGHLQGLLNLRGRLASIEEDLRRAAWRDPQVVPAARATGRA
jgi:glycosyltransferase involved in cell wall biosynthesis